MLILFFIIVLISGQAVANVLINEVMYDPELNDNYYEWIELFNPSDESINLSSWIISDNSENETLEGDFDHGNGSMIIPPQGYAIITDKGTKFYENYSVSNETIKLYVDDSSIGNGLGNSGDKLILKNETGEIIDAVKWIIDYEDVPGLPASSVLVNHSLSRHNNVDTDNSYSDFYDAAIPTPGAENRIESKPSFKIEFCPEFMPKVENDSLYSNPIAVKINISNYPANLTYQIKSYVIGNIDSSLPATQTWNGTAWEYSTYYTNSFSTDSNGNYSGWQYLRFKKDYKEYEVNVKDNSSAYLKIKIKSDDKTDELLKTLFLMDMDNSSLNGATGGYITGIFSENETFFENKTVIVENESCNITGIYLTENNEIGEGLSSIPGYFKLTSPVGVNYCIKLLDDDDSIIKNITNVTVKQGKYKVSIESNNNYYLLKINETQEIPLTVKNLGNFYDKINIDVKEITDGWDATLNAENINLNAKETGNVVLSIIPCKNECINGDMTIKASSENDVGEFDEIKISFKIFAADLTVKDVKIFNEEENETYLFVEGEIVKIKAVIKNVGDENATNVNVTCYFDYVDENHLIGFENYDSIGDYQKSPLFIWDTKDVTASVHTIYVIVDEKNNIDELSESNNKFSVDIEIIKTDLSKDEKEILIVEVYYNTHPKIHNEFITLYNPSSENVDISGWYLTKDPIKTKKDQTKIIFPNSTIINSKAYLYITENASSFTWETAKKPDFEYNVNSRFDIPQMIAKKNFSLGNSGEVVALKDYYNHTIDVVVYGKCSYNDSGWVGDTVPITRNGVLMKRITDENGTYVDTNTSIDWLNLRIYCIGQSDLPFVNFFFYGEIKTFVSPDSSFGLISDELRNAKYSIYLNMYEFTNAYLCYELINALYRNVSVNILLEGFPVGGISDEEKIIVKKIANNGGTIRFIVNDIGNNIYKRYNFNHGKYLVIDNKTLIVESCNWANNGIPKNPSYGNREWGIIIKNEIVADFFLNVFLDDWNIERCDIYSFKQMNFDVPDDLYNYEPSYNGLYEPRFESKIFIGNFSCIPVFSPDTSYKAICEMIDSAVESIYIQQLYIYKNWQEGLSPFVERLVNKSRQGVDVKVILNYNPSYDESNEKCNQTKLYLDEFGIQTKFIYSNWSIFSNIHNKGMIVDNESVLISSINWNENSVLNNREAGIIIKNKELANYYADVFFYDWDLSQPESKTPEDNIFLTDYKNTIYIVIIFTMALALIVRDWRKRKWT